MSPARPCKGLRAAVAASVGLSEGPTGSARSGCLLRPPTTTPGPAVAAPGERSRACRKPGACRLDRGAAGCGGRAACRRRGGRPHRYAVRPRLLGELLGGTGRCVLPQRPQRGQAAGRVADVYRYCHVRVPEGLLKDLLPGPVTLVMERSEELNKDLNLFTHLVGICIPDHTFMQDLAQMFGGLLALTSANLSSQASSLNVEEFQDLWPQFSLVIDGGPIGNGQSPECHLGSIVIDLSVPGKFAIISPGCALESTTAVLQQKYGLLPSLGSCL